MGSPVVGRLHRVWPANNNRSGHQCRNLQHDFTQDFRGSLLLGNEFNDNASEYYTSYGSNFSTPGWNDLDNTSVQNSEYDNYQRRTIGFFGEASVEWMDMLFLTGTGRYDIISSMPSDNRGFFYPSVSLGFVFTELGALSGQNILSFGKLRASYAEVGQAASTYRPEPIFVTGGGGSGFLSYGMEYPVNDITGYKLSSILYDPKLTPQNTRTIEFGADLRFFNNRLRVDYSYFDQTAEDQIFGVPMAGSTGYSTFYTNAGEMYSKGHEIIFNVSPIQLNSFGWDISVNFSSIKNEVVELAEGVEDIFLGGYVTPNIRASAGDAYPAIYGEKFVRDDQGRILVNENSSSPGYGLPMIGEFGLIGEVTPDFTMGLGNTFTLFGNLTLSAQLDWKQGGEMYSGSNRLMNLYGSSAKTEDRETPFVYNGYKSDGSKNDIERGGPDDQGAYQYLYSNILGSLPESNIHETSFLKLRNVSVSYSIPQKIIAPLMLEKAQIGLVMRNLLLWSTLKNFDPETSQGQGNMQGGMDYMSLPQTTNYGFNINLTF